MSPSLVFRWRRLRDEGSLASLDAGEAVVPQSEVKQLKAQIRELERLPGRKTMENEILRDAARIGREKNCFRCRAHRRRTARREAGKRSCQINGALCN
jgi:transposase-like protein